MPLLWGLRQKWMIPSCFLQKVVTFFGKEHVNWSSISGVMIGISLIIKFGKVHNLFGKNKILSAKTPLLLGLRQKFIFFIKMQMESAKRAHFIGTKTS